MTKQPKQNPADFSPTVAVMEIHFKRFSEMMLAEVEKLRGKPEHCLPVLFHRMGTEYYLAARELLAECPLDQIDSTETMLDNINWVKMARTFYLLSR